MLSCRARTPITCLGRMVTASKPSPRAKQLHASAPSRNAKPLYASQDTIPHLPVPTLSSTFAKYSETIEPLQTPEAHAKSKSAIDKFLKSPLSKTLQDRLEKRAAERDSWLSEWWNDAAYMGFRGRIVPNVSYFYVHKGGLGKGQSQEDRAAELVRATVEFKKLVDSERLEPEKGKAGPLCMASYKYLFNAVRVPTSPADIPLAYPEDTHHVVVVRNNRYFKVDTQGRGKQELAEAFRAVKRMADGTPGEGVGVLCADDRDVWTEFRRGLMDYSPNNTPAIQAIESAILLVSLDDYAPTSEDGRAWSYWSGGIDRSAGSGHGRNRWFDKHEIIVDEAGESGFNGEHSMLDGTPTLRMNEFMLAGIEKGQIPLELPEGEKASSKMPEPQEIVFEMDSKLKSAVAKSNQGFAEEMSQQDLKMLKFDGYGKNVIKTHKASPDAWAQMIKQLAFYRLNSRPPVTYESCQTRKFLLGRTEVIRSASRESKAFCEAMINSSTPDLEREKKFRDAVRRHIQYSTWAADGQGVDRHMFGLKKLIKEGEEVPEVFKDEAYAGSSHWELSTSQLSSNYLDGWGYGEVVEDGYGLSYSIHDDHIRWCITTKKGDAEQFAKALTDAAEELRGMMDRAKAAGGAEGAKL